MSPVVNIVIILVNQTKKISRDLTRFAIISQPKVQITQNKNPVEANYIAYHIIVNFYKTDIQLSPKKCSFNDALLLTHAVFTLRNTILTCVIVTILPAIISILPIVGISKYGYNPILGVCTLGLDDQIGSYQ